MMARIILVALALILALSGPLWAAALTVGLEGGGGGSLLLGLKQSSFLLEYRLSLLSSGFRGIELGLLPPLPPIQRLGVDFKPYLMLAPGRGATVGLFGERTELSGLAFLSALSDMAFSTKGLMLFLRGEYAVGNIGLRGHLQLDFGRLAVQPWAGRTEEPYFPEWALVTAGSRHSGYLSGSSLYMEIRRRFSRELTISEGFTTPLISSQVAPGILLNVELGSFALRLLRQFPQGAEEGYTLLSLGFRRGILFSPKQKRAAIFQLDLNFRWFPTRGEADFLSSYSTDQFSLRGEAHLLAKGSTFSLSLHLKLGADRSPERYQAPGPAEEPHTQPHPQGEQG